MQLGNCIFELQPYNNFVQDIMLYSILNWLLNKMILECSRLLQAYSCSTDGTVRLWDFMDDILIKVVINFGRAW